MCFSTKILQTNAIMDPKHIPKSRGMEAIMDNEAYADNDIGMESKITRKGKVERRSSNYKKKSCQKRSKKGVRESTVYR